MILDSRSDAFFSNLGRSSQLSVVEVGTPGTQISLIRFSTPRELKPVAGRIIVDEGMANPYETKIP
jgi:hypothetical protein